MYVTEKERTENDFGRYACVVCTPSNSYTPHSPRQTEPDTGAERSGDQGRGRRPRFARLIGSVTYVVIALAALERCSANQINKWRRRRRKKSEKTDCGNGAIIGDAISIDSPFLHALRCMRLPKHDEGGGRRDRGKSAAKTEPPPRAASAAARYCSRVQFLVATETARKVLQ